MTCRAQSTDLVCTSGLFGGAGRATWTNARCFDVMVPCGCTEAGVSTVCRPIGGTENGMDTV